MFIPIVGSVTGIFWFVLLMFYSICDLAKSINANKTDRVATISVILFTLAVALVLQIDILFYGVFQ